MYAYTVFFMSLSSTSHSSFPKHACCSRPMLLFHCLLVMPEEERMQQMSWSSVVLDDEFETLIEL